MGTSGGLTLTHGRAGGGAVCDAARVAVTSGVRSSDAVRLTGTHADGVADGPRYSLASRPRMRSGVTGARRVRVGRSAPYTRAVTSGGSAAERSGHATIACLHGPELRLAVPILHLGVVDAVLTDEHLVE